MGVVLVYNVNENLKKLPLKVYNVHFSHVSRADPGFGQGVSPLHFIPVPSLPYPLLPFSLEVGLLLQSGNLGSNEMVLIVVNN